MKRNPLELLSPAFKRIHFSRMRDCKIESISNERPKCPAAMQFLQRLFRYRYSRKTVTKFSKKTKAWYWREKERKVNAEIFPSNNCFWENYSASTDKPFDLLVFKRIVEVIRSLHYPLVLGILHIHPKMYNLTWALISAAFFLLFHSCISILTFLFV